MRTQWWGGLTGDTLLIHFFCMPTIKKRINITISKELDRALAMFAKRDQVPQATKAEEFLRIGMELEEDVLLETVASERYKTAGKYISHKEVWGK
ncbi:MAG: hypothetical protein UY04_C0052G0003 [Parcubacteria group bacterium GW2011_GWA2_47_7]|nr:MAG: hypothetical protein UY04_C0052G0003 [Parcubacteria group bacterium GW2011_GWA2_47_7]